MVQCREIDGRGQAIPKREMYRKIIIISAQSRDRRLLDPTIYGCYDGTRSTGCTHCEEVMSRSLGMRKEGKKIDNCLVMGVIEPMEFDRQPNRGFYWQAYGDTTLSLPSAQPDMHGWEESARRRDMIGRRKSPVSLRMDSCQWGFVCA